MIIPHSPILLVTFLAENDPTDEKISRKILRLFRKEVNISLCLAHTTDEAVAGISEWLKDNYNAQELFIDTHGGDTGIGISITDMLPWDRLWNLIRDNSKTAVNLWLGACYSSSCAKAWTPISVPSHIGFIVGYPVKVKPKEIFRMVQRLITITDINSGNFLETFKGKLKFVSPKAELYYPAVRRDRIPAFIENDLFPAETGMSFEDYLIFKQHIDKIIYSEPKPVTVTCGKPRAQRK